MNWIKKNKGLFTAMVVLLALLMVTVAVFVMKDGRASGGDPDTASPSVSQIPTEAPSPEPLTYTDITFLSAGDIMYHRPQIRAAKTDSGYDFTGNMQYVKPIIENADFATANFETTLSGPEIGYEAKQFPYFNAPDDTVDSLLYAGFDLLFMANNHCYDHEAQGIRRTLSVLDQKGMDHVGTRADESSKTYKLVDVKGIQIGLINYTLEIGSDGETVRINGNSVAPEDLALIDTFNEAAPDKLYREIGEKMADLNTQGADCIIVYLHWGNEYELKPNENQRAIAQKLCDMGVDVLLTSHPHVIQPVEVITSSDGKRTMPCYYSMGNYISNQSRNSLAEDTENAIYTENGMMPIITVRKYSNGETYIKNIEYIATWVHIHGSYEVIPVAAALNDPGAYGLNDDAVSKARHAKELTDSAAAAGVAAYNALWQDPHPEATAA